MQLSDGFLFGLSKSENKSQCNDAEIENREFTKAQFSCLFKQSLLSTLSPASDHNSSVVYVEIFILWTSIWHIILLM